ncbi:hypothetical protein O6H91_06G060000 [Diphasiastrum complanatum]|nr:hypothetical protein O6H91_06G060000 [Diphasiastrum complanatum]
MVEGKAKQNLGLCVPGGGSFLSFCSSIQNLVRRYSQITSLSLMMEGEDQNPELLEQVLVAVGSCSHFLRHFRFLAAKATLGGLQALARGCPDISSLHLMCLDPNHMPFLSNFRALRELSLVGCLASEKTNWGDVPAGELALEKLCLEGISPSNSGLGWLWLNCRKLHRLELFNCEGIGDTDTVALMQCLASVQELQLRRCRVIANLILRMVATSCRALKVLIFQDGGDTNGLHHVIRSCTSLEVLELRLPLDLFNEDLAIIAQNGVSLRSLRLHSCWMATGAGIKLLGTQLRSNLEDLALIRCRAIVQDPGTLTCLGQHLKSLRSLNLSDNDLLVDKELVAMLASSCQRLLHLKLRRCRKLTDKAMEYIGRNCQLLRSLVILCCDNITSTGLMSLLTGCQSLTRIWVEKGKLTDAVQNVASKRRVLLPASEPSTSDYQNYTFPAS